MKNLDPLLKAKAQRNLKLQGIFNFLAGAAFLTPVVTLLYLHTGLSLYEITLIANAATLISWILELPTSVLADNYGMKKSIFFSVLFSLFSALFLLFFHTFWSYVAASLCAGVSWSFISGASQAFLDQNLAVLGQRKLFGRILGKYMFYGSMLGLLIPFIASGLLYLFKDMAFTLLAFLDVLITCALLYFVSEYQELTPLKNDKKTFKEQVLLNLEIGKQALQRVFNEPALRLILIYRSLANHVSYLPLILFPVLVTMGMPDWYSGGILFASTLLIMCSQKYSYLIGEKFGYGFAWVMPTLIQALLLIVCGLFLSSWIVVVIIYLVFTCMDGIWTTAWNHVLVEHTDGEAVATTRSVIFGMFALYTTIGKQILSFIPLSWALVGLGVFILVVNIIWGRKIMQLSKS